MKTDEMIISIPPSANALHKKTQWGVHRTPNYKAWIKTAGHEIMVLRSEKRIIKLGRGWYKTEIHWPAEDPADADNRTKALHDLLHSMQITPDDKWLWGSSQERSWHVKPGTCKVRFWTLDEEETRPPLGT